MIRFKKKQNLDITEKRLKKLRTNINYCIAKLTDIAKQSTDTILSSVNAVKDSINSFNHILIEQGVTAMSFLSYPYLKHMFVNAEEQIGKIQKIIEDYVKFDSSEGLKEFENLSIHCAFMVSEFLELHSDRNRSSGYQCAKADAQQWWEINFGESNGVCSREYLLLTRLNTAIQDPWTQTMVGRALCSIISNRLKQNNLRIIRYTVEWEDFSAVFCMHVGISGQPVIRQLHDSINFSSSTYISIFVFDIFTRLYAPWEHVGTVWKNLVNHPGYFGLKTFRQTTRYLQRHGDRPGTFVFRVSGSNLGYWSVGYVSKQNTTAQTICWTKFLADFLHSNNRLGRFLFAGDSLDFPLMTEITNLKVPQMVEQEKLNLYDSEENFNICPLCDSEPRDIRFEPCLHLAGSECARKWLCKGGTCPNCRQPIKSISQVELIFTQEVSNNSDESVATSTSEMSGAVSNRELPEVPEQTEYTGECKTPETEVNPDLDTSSIEDIQAQFLDTQASAASNEPSAPDYEQRQSQFTTEDSSTDEPKQHELYSYFEGEVQKALRLASGDEDFALRILQEFVGPSPNS